MKKLCIACSLFTIIFTGCTSVKVTPLPNINSYNNICIEKNDKVIVPNFLDIIVNRIEDYGIKTTIYSGGIPNFCDIYLRYTALQTWDITLYMSHSEIYIYDRSGNEIANGIYHLINKGGLTLTKFASVESKITPVLDEIFANYIGNKPISEAERNSSLSVYYSSEKNLDEEARLQRITELHHKGLITDEEFEAKRKEILEEI